MAGRHLAGAAGAVVLNEAGAVLMDLAVEQAAPQRQVEHLPLTCSRKRSLGFNSSVRLNKIL